MPTVITGRRIDPRRDQLLRALTGDEYDRITRALEPVHVHVRDRKQITIRDRKRLTEASRSCYQLIRAEFGRLLGADHAVDRHRSGCPVCGYKLAGGPASTRRSTGSTR